MKQCPKCSSPHDKPGIFCSRKCANSRVFSDETKRKKSEALKGLTSWRRGLTASTDPRIKLREIKPVEEGEELSRFVARKIILREQNGCCLHCGLSTWLGEPICIEIDHIDGNNRNNVRGNLRGLCPNCHSQTPTWRGRKTKSISAAGRQGVSEVS